MEFETVMTELEIPMFVANVDTLTIDKFKKSLESPKIIQAFSLKKTNDSYNGSYYKKYGNSTQVRIELYLSSSLKNLTKQVWTDQEKWLNFSESDSIQNLRHCSLYFCTENLQIEPALLFGLLEQCMMTENIILSYFNRLLIFRSNGDLYVTDLFEKIFKVYYFDLIDQTVMLLPIQIRFVESEGFDSSIYDSKYQTIKYFIKMSNEWQ